MCQGAFVSRSLCFIVDADPRARLVSAYARACRVMVHRIVALHTSSASSVLGIGSVFVVTVTTNRNETGLGLASAVVNGVNLVLLEKELTSDTQRYLWNKLAT